MEVSRISKSIVSRLPLFIKKDYPRFVQFIEDYYKSLEVSGSPLNFISKFDKFIDIDQTDTEFLDYFTKTFIPELPVTVTNKKTLIKHIREHYRAKGSEHSIKFLFRILFDEEVDIIYPYYDILNVSDGKWTVTRSLKTEKTSLFVSENLVGCEAIGLTSGARGIVESFTEGQAPDGTLFVEVTLKEFDKAHPLSLFSIGENISVTSYDSIYSFNEKILSVCSSVEVLTPGKYYREGDKVSIISSTGTGATAYVKDIYPGSVRSVSIVDGGTGYDITKCVLSISTDSLNKGREARAKISGVDDITGAITEITMLESGNGYTSLPVVTVHEEDGVGTGCVLLAISDDIGRVKNVKMSNTGVNYELDSVLTYNGVPVTLSGVQVTCPAQIASAVFIRTFLLYDKSGPLTSTERITGDVSGATGQIRRLSTYNNIAAVEELTGQFCIYDTITGVTSGETAKIFDIGSATGLPVHSGISESEGYYKNTDGQLSSNKYIQDSYYYQKYSYVITTTRRTVEWKNTLYNTVHPAGTIVFSYDDVFVPVIETEYGGALAPTLEMFNLYTVQPFSTYTYDKVYVKQFEDYRISELDINTVTPTGYCPGCELSLDTYAY
jgi:hypothetical protein